MILKDLIEVIKSRKNNEADQSYTASLFNEGLQECCKKFGEEAVEALIEAVKGDHAALTSEAADVLYHLLVMLASRDIPLDDVLAELSRRTAQSGLEEKAHR